MSDGVRRVDDGQLFRRAASASVAENASKKVCPRCAARAPRPPSSSGGRARPAAAAREERLGVDADRERSDGRPVSREGGRVGADVRRAVGRRQDEPRDLHEIVVLGRAPEGGGRRRRPLATRSAASFSAASAFTSVRSGPPKRPACCPAKTADASPRASDASLGSASPAAGRGRKAARTARALLRRSSSRSGRSGRKAETSGVARREAAREGGNPGNVRERNRRHRSLSARAFAVAFTARRIRRGDFRRSNGEPSKFPYAARTVSAAARCRFLSSCSV